ncbi:hypothetical protein PILCRDRAFT_16965 [Piloderma croceum F 1598]|uniref:Uncharacterized protein n=1 Tax=Piloderma croceum (strain F 1598) TaxID=765440 RepID=A0A0C3EU14_PILCF|nr:hypothetical protein PILCRDRAFT_16965 [Piloderma croceum F 1598]
MSSPARKNVSSAHMISTLAPSSQRPRRLRRRSSLLPRPSKRRRRNRRSTHPLLQLLPGHVYLGGPSSVSTSTTEGLMQAQDTVYHRMQANLYEMRVLLTQQCVGYEELDEINRRLREIQDMEEIEEVDDGEEEEINEIEDQLDL